MLARIVAAETAGLRLAGQLRGDLERIAESAAKFPRRPRVFFEEWSDPLISGIRWVDELVELAGGEPVFPRLREEHSATGRIVTPRSSWRPPIRTSSSLPGAGEKSARNRFAGVRTGPNPGGALRSHLRDQVDLHPAARPRLADRRSAATAHHPGPRSQRPSRRRGWRRWRAWTRTLIVPART